MDAFRAFLQVRDSLNEASESHWKDRELLQKMNFEYKRIWMDLALQAGDWLVDSTSVTFSDSEATLPSACGKPIYLENAQGYRIPFRGTVRERRQYNLSVQTFDTTLQTAYVAGNKIVVNADSVSGTWTLWYIKRYTPMAFGVAGANCAATALHFESTQLPSIEDDAYNGLGVNTYTTATYAPKLSDTITDYVGSTLIATITGTPAQGDLYGTVLEQPEEADGLLVIRTVLNALAKPSTAIDPKYFQHHQAVLRQSEESWRNWLETRIPGNRRVRLTGGLDG